MQNLEIFLKKLKEDYLKASKLVDEKPKNAEKNWYKSLHEARDIFMSILNEIKSYHQHFNNDINSLKLIPIVMHFYLGAIAFECEDYISCQQWLESGLNLLSELKSSKYSFIYFEINFYYQFISLWTSRMDYSKAMIYLNLCESAYYKWKEEPENSKNLLHYIDCFELNSSQLVTDQKIVEKIETIFDTILDFGAQILQKMGKKKESAVKCIQALKRQYLHGKYDHLEWFLNVATLSQYFASYGQFHIAQHLLTSARFVLNEYLKKNHTKNEKVQKSVADLNRILVKYYLMLLNSNKSEINLETLELNESDLKILPSSMISMIEKIEGQIYANPVRTYENARSVFLEAKSCLQLALNYYTLNEHATDHIECIQDLSKLYQALIKFENVDDRKCKMHKRRINVLSEVLNNVNRKYFLDYCRQLLFELAEIYNEMADIKLKNCETKTQKINNLFSKSIQHYQLFLETFTQKQLERVEMEMVRPLITAYFSIGMLYTKLFCEDSKNKVNNLNLCQFYYRKVKQYVEKNLDQKDLVEQEVVLIDEFLTLTEQRIEKF